MTDIIHEDRGVRRSLRRWEAAGVVVLLLLVIAFPAYKAVESGRRADALASYEHALVTTGGQLFGLNCSSCHGTNGQGVDAPALNSQEFLNSVTDQQMQGIVAGGVPGTEMPAWWDEYGGPLTDQQIAAIVSYVRSWQATAPSVPNWRNPGGTMESGHTG